MATEKKSVTMEINPSVAMTTKKNRNHRKKKPTHLLLRNIDPHPLIIPLEINPRVVILIPAQIMQTRM